MKWFGATVRHGSPLERHSFVGWLRGRSRSDLRAKRKSWAGFLLSRPRCLAEAKCVANGHFHCRVSEPISPICTGGMVVAETRIPCRWYRHSRPRSPSGTNRVPFATEQLFACDATSPACAASPAGSGTVFPIQGPPMLVAERGRQPHDHGCLQTGVRGSFGGSDSVRSEGLRGPDRTARYRRPPSL